MGCRKLDITNYFRLTDTTNLSPTRGEKICAQKKSPRGFKPVVSVSIPNYRYYSPELGRWINRDPIGERGGANLYGMVFKIQSV